MKGGLISSSTRVVQKRFENTQKEGRGVLIIIPLSNKENEN